MPLKYKAPINFKDKWDRTPLHNAAWQGHIETVKFLLEKGADKSMKNEHQQTPLEVARVEGNTDVVELIESWS